MLHVHIGPSPLGLGLLVPITLSTGFDVCLVGRPGSENQREYGCAGTGPSGSLSYHTVSWFEGPEEPDDLPTDLLRRIRSNEALLLTCTLRKAIASRQAFVEGTLAMRPPSAETVLLPCENAPDGVYEKIANSCRGDGLSVLRTVVNRMCMARDPDIDGRRMVFAHPLGEWLIERSAMAGEIFSALEVADEVEVVDDIGARHDRKLWMVNGAHQALALMARKGSQKALRVPAVSDAGRRVLTAGEELDDMSLSGRDVAVVARLSHLHGAMDDALSSEHPALEGNLDYAEEHVIAYAEHPDSIKRVLEAFKREDLAPFVKTLDLRLARPARTCHALGRSVAPFAFVFDIFEDLAADRDAFLDAERVRLSPHLIDAEADAKAVAAYAHLVDGWMASEEAEKRISRFTKGLAAHRR